MRKILTVVVLLTIIFLLIRDVNAQEKVYLPVIFSEGNKMACEYPILAISNGEETINLLDEGSGLQLADPYWSPNIAQLKGGGTFVDPQTADGRSLVSAQYGNVIETIPIRITGEQGWITIRNLRRMLNLSVNAQAYWTQIFEQDRVWMEVLPKGDNFLSGYSTIYTISIPNITSPYTRPFANPIDKSQFDTINIILEREPFFSPLKPGEIIGPLYNLIKNPDFELWNFGVGDSQPDSWDDLQTVSIIGTNNRYQTNPKWGNNAIKVSVTGSTAIGEAKGVTQVIEDTQNNATYTILAWVKNDGISNGVGRILVNYSNQLELYRDDSIHGWQLYSGTITTGVFDTVSINLQILSTGNNTLGDVFFDGLMFVEGDYLTEAADNLIPYMTSSHVVNHTDLSTGTIEAGDINFVEAWNLPGDVDSKIQLNIVNNNTPSDTTNIVEVYKIIRAGLRRTGDVFQFENIVDDNGDNDLTAASDSKVTIPNVTTSWLTVTEKSIVGSELVNNNEGIFKLYVRLKDTKPTDSNLSLRVSYTLGTPGINEIVLPVVTLPIANEWAVVDLTANKTIDFSTKFLSETTGTLYYKIETKRDSGTWDVEFDYSILLPTDGGFIDVDTSPSVSPNNKLLVDNIGKLTVKGNTTPISKTLYETSGNSQVSIVFDGKLFTSFANNIVTWDGENISTHEFSNDNADLITAFKIYNNTLYALGIRNGAGTGFWIYNGGTSWTRDDTLGGIDFFSGAVYDNKLWISGFDQSVYSYNGTSFVTEYTGPPPGILFGITTLTKYNNDLIIFNQYEALPAGTPLNVVIYDGVSFVNTGDQGIGVQVLLDDSMIIFNNELYVTTATGLHKFDGFSWFPEIATSQYSLVEYNNTLYSLNDGNPLIIRKRITDSQWDIVHYIGAENRTAGGMSLYQGEIVGSGTGTAPIDSILFSYNDNENWFSVPTYNGGGFSAPPRTLQSDSRHRYFFSYDRENFVNNIDDKALIGIGYRPRYFSLINKDEF